MSDRANRWQQEHAQALVVARCVGRSRLMAAAALIDQAISESWTRERLQAAIHEVIANA